MLRRKNTGQSAVEYVLLLVVVLGAFVAIQTYVKRGLQGRWRDAVDDLGDQYDPRTASTSIRHRLSSSTNTDIVIMNETVGGGYWTMRTDEATSTERKTGSTSVGAY